MSNPTAPIAIGDRRMIPVVDLVGPGLVAARVYPHLPPAQLSRLLDAYGDEYADPTRATGKVSVLLVTSGKVDRFHSTT